MDSESRNRDDQPIVAAMFRALHALGRGTVKRVNERLGWPPRSIYKYAARGLRVRELTQILRVAEIHPRWFFSCVFGTAGALERFLAEARALELEHGELLPRLGDAVPAPSRLSWSELRQVDDLANVDPEAAAGFAARLAQQAADDGRVGDAAAMMVRRGWALRTLMDYHGAHACLGWSLPRLDPGPQRVDGMIRAAFLTLDYTASGDAVEIAGEAIVAAAQHGDLAGIGRALVTRATALGRLGDTAEALRGLRTAIDLLPDDRRHSRYRFSACQSLAALLIVEGELEQAERALRDAARHEIPPGIPAAKACWLRAHIAGLRDDHESAIELYEEAMEGLEPSLGDVALIACELVEILYRTDRHAQAVALCKSVARCIRATTSPILNAALGSLVRSALRGRLEKALIDEATRKVRQAKTPSRPAVLSRPR